MSDEEIIQELTKLRGVGKWTAEMILIFTMLRPDVFPIGDIGMIRGLKNHTALEKGCPKRSCMLFQRSGSHGVL